MIELSDNETKYHNVRGINREINKRVAPNSIMVPGSGTEGKSRMGVACAADENDNINAAQANSADSFFI